MTDACETLTGTDLGRNNIDNGHLHSLSSVSRFLSEDISGHKPYTYCSDCL